MNRSEFFATAKITRAPIVVEQENENGYFVSMEVKHDDEEAQKFTLMYKNEPRYFKSLGSIETLLKEKEIYNFSVRMTGDKVKVQTRAKA